MFEIREKVTSHEFVSVVSERDNIMCPVPVVIIVDFSRFFNFVSKNRVKFSNLLVLEWYNYYNRYVHYYSIYLCYENVIFISPNVQEWVSSVYTQCSWADSRTNIECGAAAVAARNYKRIIEILNNKIITAAAALHG